jgi:hypothetical protein
VCVSSLWRSQEKIACLNVLEPIPKRDIIDARPHTVVELDIVGMGIEVLNSMKCLTEAEKAVRGKIRVKDRRVLFPSEERAPRDVNTLIDKSDPSFDLVVIEVALAVDIQHVIWTRLREGCAGWPKAWLTVSVMPVLQVRSNYAVENELLGQEWHLEIVGQNLSRHFPVTVYLEGEEW